MQTKTIILGTAGHIDHGKTTLVRALTGIDTDRLKEEKERGITIELGFAHLDLPNGQRIGVVDVPGHERFVKNMVAGATGIDILALVIAADEGVMPQTKEHLEICQFLGIQKGIIVLTKKDMVEPDWLELVQADVMDFVKNSFLADAPVVAVSSTTGEGIPELLQTLQKIAANLPHKTLSGPYRLPVDRVFTVKGFGTVVTGSAISGSIRLGDEAMVYPSGKTCKIRGIQTHSTAAAETGPGVRTALNLQGIEREEIERGDVVSTPNGLRQSLLLDLHLTYSSSNDKRLKDKSPVRFHTGTAEIMGRVFFRTDEIEPGETVFAQIKLEKPCAVLPGDHFVIRNYSPVFTTGGGVILNPLPRKRKKSSPQMWREIEVLAKGTIAEKIEYHLQKADKRGLLAKELMIRTGVFGKTFEKELEKLRGGKKIMAIEQGDNPRFLHADIYNKLQTQLTDILSAYHANNPISPGLSKEELKSRLFPVKDDPKCFAKLIGELISGSKIVQDKELIRLASHQSVLEDDQGKTMDKLDEIYKKAGMLAPTKEEANDQAGIAKDKTKPIWELLVRQGRLIHLKDELYYHSETIRYVKDRLVSYFKTHDEIGINEFRELLPGISRKYMIPLLEYLDNQRFTIRVGDKRKLRG